MKKITFIALAAAAAALGFTSCQKNEIASEETLKAECDFKIYADFTKTTISGYATKWADGDAINVFHAEAGSTTYSDNSQFTISDADNGVFTGTLSGTLAASNDWYALYPYNSYVNSPANTNGYKNIGSSYKTTAEVQNGNNSTAHLAGQYFPLYAKAGGIAQAGKVSLTFKPALSIVKFHVTNGTAKAITVSSISMTAQEDIIGSYYINFAGATPTFTASGANYVEKTAKLSVTGGEEIAAGGSADFYMAIKPFTNEAGSTLTFNVNGQERTSTAAAIFECGKVKTVNFTYDKESKVLDPGTYVALVPNSGTSYYALSSTASGTRLLSADVKYDGGGSYETTDASIVWNVTKEEGGYLFENGSKYVSWSSGNNAAMSEDKYYLSVTEDGDYFKVTSVADATRVLSRNSSNAYFAFYGNTGQKYTFTFVPATFKNIPVISPIADPDKVAAAGATDVEVSYTITNPVAGKSVSAKSADSWVNSFNYDTDGKIIFTVNENTVAEERSTVVTVSYEGANDVTFTVSQSAAGSVTQYTAVYTVDTKSTVKTTGKAPAGSSATYTQTYGTTCQATSGNSFTLTLKGYSGKTIKGITLSMKSNSSKGAGSFSATAGSTSIAELSATGFNKWYDNTSFGTTYRDVKVTLTNNAYVVGASDDVVISIAATENSLYCQSYSITYE